MLARGAADQEDFSAIFRRNTPYGAAIDHGTVLFVGFASGQRRL